MILSLRQASIQIGMNTAHILELTRIGVLIVQPGSTKLRPKYLKSQFDALVFGTHYVICAACGSWCGQITTKHLLSCSHMKLKDYMTKWPNSPIMCLVVKTNKIKTNTQRNKQSATLIARFKTVQGEMTRQQISTASKQMHAKSTKSKDALVALNRTTHRRNAVSANSKHMWEFGKQREVTQKWHQSNRNFSLKSIEYARSFIVDKSMSTARAALSKTSKLHLKFKQRMLRAGIHGFITEGSVGIYSIDEANFERHIAIEIDGCYWHGCDICGFHGVKNVRTNDKAKTNFLESIGWTVIRIPEHMIVNNPIEAIQTVTNALNDGGDTHD